MSEKKLRRPISILLPCLLFSPLDGKYRTLRQSASRGIAGHSMGGYGALKTGMKHPETDGAVCCLSACCLGWGSDLASGNPAWDGVLSLNPLAEIKEHDFFTRFFWGLPPQGRRTPAHAVFRRLTVCMSG